MNRQNHSESENRFTPEQREALKKVLKSFT